MSHLVRHRHPHGIGSLSPVGYEDVFVVVVPELLAEGTEDLDVVAHIDIIDGVYFPLRESRIEVEIA